MGSFRGRYGRERAAVGVQVDRRVYAGDDAEQAVTARLSTVGDVVAIGDEPITAGVTGRSTWRSRVGDRLRTRARDRGSRRADDGSTPEALVTVESWQWRLGTDSVPSDMVGDAVPMVTDIARARGMRGDHVNSPGGIRTPTGRTIRIRQADDSRIRPWDREHIRRDTRVLGVGAVQPVRVTSGVSLDETVSGQARRTENLRPFSVRTPTALTQLAWDTTGPGPAADPVKVW